MKLPCNLKKIFSVLMVAAFFSNGFADSTSGGLYSGHRRTADEGFAADEFRRGVQAYYRGFYNEAILEFEKALSYLPDDKLILDWVGKAYYKAGLEGTALQTWKKAMDDGYGGLLLQNKVEIVQERRVSKDFDSQTRWTEAGSYHGVFDGKLIFSGPAGIVPNNDGSIWVLAYGSNELIKINVNGYVLSRNPGPLNGFDRPIDMIRLSNGKILVSEEAGDRLALLSSDGKFEKYYGSKGRNLGQLLGPQFLSQNQNGNIFVSDYGNSRVCVFDIDGNPLFSFGTQTQGFSGLRGPTGIASINNLVYVCDDYDGAIYEFDNAGNYRRKLVESGSFKKPESMKVWEDFLVVCDMNKVYSVDTVNGSVMEIMSAGNIPSHLTCAVPDANGNVIVSDLNKNEVYVMAKLQELIGGLFVQVERVDAHFFPDVRLEVRVESRLRKPVVGLREENFNLTENGKKIENMKFAGATSESNFADVTILLDRSVSTKEYEQQVDQVVREISRSMNNTGILRIVSAGKIPLLEYYGVPNGGLEFSCKGLKTDYAQEVPLDLAIRLCANDLIGNSDKRAILFVTAGKATSKSFAKYSLAETVAYLNNNSISFSQINLVQRASDEEIAYVVDKTPGKEYYVYRQEGLSNVINDIIDIPVSLYTLTYTSSLGAGFGETYLPVEVQADIMNKSGRDEAGYFAPLQ